MYTYTYVSKVQSVPFNHFEAARPDVQDGLQYGQFSKCHACFCGLDSGNLKFETARTSNQHICF